MFAGRVNLLERWSAGAHGPIDLVAENGTIKVSGSGGWTGGYVQPSQWISGEFVIVVARNASAQPNGFHLELKDEHRYLSAEGKIWVELPRDTQWHALSIGLQFADAGRTRLNYLALSDHLRPFELKGVWVK